MVDKPGPHTARAEIRVKDEHGTLTSEHDGFRSFPITPEGQRGKREESGSHDGHKRREREIGGRGTHVVRTISEPRINVVEDVGDDPV